MRSCARAPLALLMAALALPACTATHVAPGGPAPGPFPPAEPAPLRAGLRAGVHGANVPRVQAGEVVARVAERLAAAELFAGVVYPVGPLAAVEPDLLLEVSVSSRCDLHFWRNLLADVAVGVSLLLLQPFVPTVYDLEVELVARAADVAPPFEVRQRSRLRFESNWLHPPEEALAAWHRAATAHAVEGLVAKLRGARGPWRRAAAP